MSSLTELRVNRRNTVAFIAKNPSQLALQPQARQRTATGGFAATLSPARAPQTFRVIDLSSGYNVDQPPQRTIDGVEKTVQFMLLGAYDTIINLYDVWTDANGQWQVTQVFPENGYEQRALAVRHGD